MRQDARPETGDPGFPGRFTRRTGVVARQHPDRDSQRVQPGDGPGRRGFQRIGKGEHGARPLLVGEPNHGLRLLHPPFGQPLQAGVGHDAVAGQQRVVPGIPGPPLRDAPDTLSGNAFEPGHGNVPLPAERFDDGLRKRMPRAFFKAEQNPPRRLRPFGPRSVHNRRTAFGERSGLVQHHGVDLPGHLQARSVLDEDALSGALADPDHEGRGRSQPQRTGARDDQHGHQRQQPAGEALLRREEHPRREGQHGEDDDGGNENAGDPVDGSLHGGLAALRIPHHADDPGQHRVLPHPVGPETERTVAIHRSGEHRRTLLLADGERFPAEHALVDIRRAFGHRAVHGDAFAGMHGDQIPGAKLRNGHGAFARRGDHRDGFRLQAHQFRDGRRRAALRPLLKQPPQQDEGDDDGRRLEIDVRLNAPRQPKFREKQVEKAEQIGDSGTDGNQRIHVGRPVAELFPGVDEELPSQSENDRGGERPHGVFHGRSVHEQHTSGHNRKTKPRRPKSPPFERPVMRRTNVRRLVLRRAFRVGQQVVTGRLHGPLQRPGRALPRTVVHPRRSGSVVHMRRLDARQAVERLIDPDCARSAAHACDRERIRDDLTLFHGNKGKVPTRSGCYRIMDMIYTYTSSSGFRPRPFSRRNSVGDIPVWARNWALRCATLE